MKFIIDRSKWRCETVSIPGKSLSTGHTYLLNNKGYMCCLGQISLQLGQTINDIFNLLEPDEIRSPSDDASVVLFDDYDLCTGAMGINDNAETTVHEKERLLKELFSRYNHEIEFVN